MKTRSQRNADYRRTGAPAMQDAAPEPPTERLSVRWWLDLVAVIVIGSVIAIGIFKVLDMMGL